MRTGRLGLLLGGAALALGGGVGAAVLPGHGGAAAAGADVVVVHGTSFPDASRAGLSLVGCDSMYGVHPESPQPMIGQGPGDAPIGDRSLAYDLAGGNALGAMFRVSSVATTTTASISVHPWGTASTGVAYVGYQAPDDDGSGRFWLGRADVSAPGAVWSTIDAAHRDYTWTQYDLATQEVTDAGPGQAESVTDFVGLHGGDGPGVYTVGFGCNGTAFNLDDLRISSGDGSTTYDLEGLTTNVSMSHTTAPSGEVVLHGALRSGSGDALPDSTLMLEQSSSASGPWKSAGALPVNDGVASTVVAPEEKTWYRWRFVDRPLAAGSVSAAYAVDGTGVEPTASPTTDPTTDPTPTTGPTTSPTQEPTHTPTQEPSDSPSSSPSQSPSQQPSQSPSDSPSKTPSESPSDSPTSTNGPTATQEPSNSPDSSASEPIGAAAGTSAGS